MRLEDMRAQVQAELEHIPGWPKEPQNKLRMLYWSNRMRSLGKKAERNQSALAVLQECIEFLRKADPHLEFQYDKAFFKAKSN
jgi:hypothetical protein